jgi:hypothetical protein
VAEFPLPAPAAAAVAFDMHGGRALVACLNGDIVCLRSGAAAAVLQQEAERQQEADRRPAKRRRVAGVADQAAREPGGPQMVLPPAGAAGSRPEPDAAECAGRASSVHADAVASFAACAAASVASPIFGRPAVDAATGITVCASVAGEVVALSAGEDRKAGSYTWCCVSVSVALRGVPPSDNRRPVVSDCSSAADFERRWTTHSGAPLYAPLSLLQPASSHASAEPHNTGSRARGDSDGSDDMEAGSGTVVLAADQAGRASGLCLRCGRLLWVLNVQCSSSGNNITGGASSGGGSAVVPLRASLVVCRPLLPAGSAATGLPCGGRQEVAWTAGPGAAGVAEAPDSRCVCCSPKAAIASDAAAVSSSATHLPVPAAAAAVPHAAAAMPAETFSTPLAFGGRMVFGCRDDHLYCVSWARHT